MRQKLYSTYNPFFLVPYVLWLVIGGILFMTFDKRALFAAVNTHYSDFGNWFMYYTTWLGEGWVITSIVALSLILFPAFRNWWYLITASLCAGLPSALSQWMKHLHSTPRPLNFFNKAAWIHIMPQWPVLMKNSFPSGHTTGAFSLMCFLSFMLPARYRPWGIVLFFIALMVAYSRLYLAAHFYEDAYVGSIIGGFGTLIIYTVMKRYQPYFFKNKNADSKAVV